MGLTVGTDTYATRAEADAYWLSRGNPDVWNQASVEDKETALRYACFWLDSRYDWIGVPANLTQQLSWPRLAAFDWEGRYISPNLVDNLPQIPQLIKDAQCEAALSHIRDQPLNAVKIDQKSVIRSVRAGSVGVTYGPDGGYVLPVYRYIDSMLNRLKVSGGAQSVGILRS